MGHRKSIVRQAVERLQGMAAWGQSKHMDKLENGGKPQLDRIYSHSTMANYQDAAARYADWARSAHGCRDIDQARAYTGEYLRQRMDEGMSAWTVRRDAAALAKLYQTSTTELGATLPTRHRADVTQHRENKSIGHFSPEKHRDLVDFAQNTGLRRHEIAQLRPQDVRQTADGRTLVSVHGGKGGKDRVVTALNDRPFQIAQAAAGKSQIFEKISKYAPIHGYRAQFAQEMYSKLARDTATLPRSEVYCCRADRAGTHYDKAAMAAVSEALGHSRLDVVTSYLK